MEIEVSAAYPQERDREARERLLEAAIEAFAKSGYDGTSLRAIAESAGVAFQLIAYHFGSKDELWRAAVDLAYRRYVEYGRSWGLDLHGDPREQFRAHLRMAFGQISQGGTWQRIVTHEFLASSVRYREFIKPRIEESIRLLGEPYHEQLEKLGVITRFSAREANLTLMAFFTMALVRPDDVAYITGHPPGSIQSINLQADLVFSVCVKGRGRDLPSELTEGTTSGQQLVTRLEPGHRWGEQYEGLAPAQLARLATLERENERLKLLLGELTLENRLLKDGARSA